MTLSIVRRCAVVCSLLGAMLPVYADAVFQQKDVPSVAVKAIPKVVYGTDDRIDTYAETSRERLRVAAAGCALILSDAIVDNGDGTFDIRVDDYTYGGVPPCSDEPFRIQKTAPFCSGFLVAPNIIATAGHCIGDVQNENGSDCYAYTDVKIVFGFRMTGPTRETIRVNADQVYTPITKVSRNYTAGGVDYSLYQLERNVVAYGAAPLNLRRFGTIPLQTQIGVIGHPWGLPQKIAFGANTKVYLNSQASHFTANLDTFGGNSGSPVFNAASHVLEGILVRGATDFVQSGGCFRSNYVADGSAGSDNGEESTKATQFAGFVPAQTKPWFNQIVYGPGQSIKLMLSDTNVGSGDVTVTVSTGAGDTQNITLSDPDGDRVYIGGVPLAAAGSAVTPNNSQIEGSASDTITALYNDANGEGGSGAAPVSATAPLDGLAPTFSNLELAQLTPTSALIRIQTSERCEVALQYGFFQNEPQLEQTQTSGETGLTHTFSITGLGSCQKVYYRFIATDAAGNSALANNNGFDYELTTPATVALFDAFEPNALPGWSTSAAQGTNNWALRTTSVNAPSGTNTYAFWPGKALTTDAFLVSPVLPVGATLEFWHNYEFEYSANGNFDGARLEYSINGGNSWQDMGSRILENGYNGTISNNSNTDYGNPIYQQTAWVRNTLGEFRRVRVNIDGLTNLKIRFRFCADSDIASGGWEIDNLMVGTPLVCPNAAPGWATYQ